LKKQKNQYRVLSIFVDKSFLELSIIIQSHCPGGDCRIDVKRNASHGDLPDKLNEPSEID